MNIIKIVLTVVVLFACLPLIYDNRDQSIWQERVDSKVFLAASSRRLLLEHNHLMSEEVEAKEEERKEKLKSIFSKTQNVCLNGRNPTNLEERVTEFVNGPCSPVILVPGLAGTSLQLKIDCEKLLLERPEVFKSCGWGTCSSWNVWYSRPEEEYRLWISTTTSAVSSIQTSSKDQCFGNLMQMKYDTDNQPLSQAGVEITYYGNTNYTRKYNECGLNGIQSMTDDYVIKYMMCDYKGFLNIGELLKNMGYISGLLFQAIPYDYRIAIKHSEAGSRIKSSIDNLYEITGKKIIIMTHSLGSLHTLNALQGMTQSYKDTKISNVMTMGAPYLGSSKAIRAHLGGDPSFLDTFLGKTVGINYYNQNKVINSASSQVDIYPKDTFNIFKDQEWMKQIQLRIQQEKLFLQDKTTNVTALDWFPNPTLNCTNLTSKLPNCLMYLQDLTESFLEIDEQPFTTKDINTLLDNYTINGTLIKSFYSKNQLDGLEELKNPGVPFIILYGGFAETEYQFTYLKNPKEIVEKTNDFYFPNKTTYSYGDQTVLTSSALIPAIKWIYELKHNISSNPIKVIELCSIQGQQQIYNLIDNQGQKSFDSNSSYMGLQCECLAKGSNINDCKHSCMINDKYIIQLVSDLVQNNQKSIFGRSQWNNTKLQYFLDNCQNL